MRKSFVSHAVLASAVFACLTALVATPAMAREGSARSIGNGVKCRNATVLQANGTYKVERVCYKGV